MRLLISFAALFLSITFLQLSSGAIGPLDALSGHKLGFSKNEIGILGSAHFLGFFVGCWWSPRLMGTVGHTRAFAAFAAFGAIGAIAHPLMPDPTAWAIMRIMTGLCVAGCYTVIEAWMQAKLTNQTRGRVMGSYRVVDIGASSLAQLMIGVLEPASYVSYNLLAILCCACLFPLTLSRIEQPKVPAAPRLHPIRTAILSPLGAAGVMVAGTTSAAFRMVSPIYGQEIGLTAQQIGSFLATVLIGGAVAQFPVGYLADKFDRRHVLIGLSLASVVVCVGFSFVDPTSYWLVFVMAALFGIMTFPIFSVSAAHANDFAKPENVVEVNASLMFIYAVGAILSPVVATALITGFGPSALFLFISAAHVFLVVFGLARMGARPTSGKKTRYKYVPRTSYLVGRLLRKKR
ncbi:MFS transporter [Neptunicoccus sediminis]|uniref:MFS transporter n=1 Tax=Neptunicoccus sediminis TaxID=1892596 RepID=UPI000845D8A7|nr:MFS transporter [Neptunicoccus sediminis]